MNRYKPSGLMAITKFALLTGLLSAATAYADPVPPLELPAAERMALDIDPVTKSFMARAEGLNEQAIADGQLADPKLKLGATNFPTDTFERSQEAMTQVQIGLQQAIPPGKTLRYRRERTEAIADIEEARALERSLDVLRKVRLRYLQLYYQSVSASILEQNKKVFSQLLDITQRQYAAGRDIQHDVLRAQLELSLIDDRILEVTRNKEAAMAELGKFIGSDEAGRPLPDEFPQLADPPPLTVVRDNLADHPLVRIEDAILLASEKKIGEAEEQYKPGFNIDVTYGFRNGRDFGPARGANGDARADFLTAMLLVDLPIFRDKRQDRRLAAAKKQSLAVQFSRTDRLLELASLAEREAANWKRLSDRLSLYEMRATADAKMNADSTLRAYQNDVADFTTLMRAQLTELDTQLDMLRVRVERAKAQAELLYLAGE